MQQARWAMRYAFVAFFGLSSAAHAAAIAACTKHADAGDRCRLGVMDARPTQLTYGSAEVKERTKTFKKMSADELEDYLKDKDNEVPVVIGPAGGMYVTDHHHLIIAVAAATSRHATVIARIIGNWSDLSVVDFWTRMDQQRLIWLYDENGNGPLSRAQLQPTLFTLRDDPYRSLAWGVRKNNGYDDTDYPHADFLWANFFRPRVAKRLIDNDFDTAVDRGSEFARSPAARHLPGYKGD